MCARGFAIRLHGPRAMAKPRGVEARGEANAWNLALLA